MEARKKIVAYLHSELVGPTEGAESEIDGDPVDRYCAGVLYPQGILEADAARDSAGISDDALSDEESADAQPGHEEVAGDGALNTANEQRPSAMGISFVLKSEKSVGFTVTAHVARYLEESSKWFRTESSWTTTFESKLAGTHPEVVNQDGPLDNADIRLQARIRQVKDKELGKIAVITVTMINSNQADKQGRPNTAKCCFESSFTVTPTDGTQLTRYVGERSLSYDDEEQELDLRYWNQRHYAIGHGTGASWKESEPGVCHSVSAVIFPEAIVRGLDFVVAGIPANTLSLQWLANDRVQTADLRTGLEALCDKYEEWIGAQRAQDVPKELIAAKERIVTRQDVALRRMRLGVELLCGTGSNPNTLRSFRLANESVLRQMIMSTDAYGGRSRPRDLKPAPKLDPMDEQWAGRQWRPFQLAFILLTISSLAPKTTDDQKDRDLVDLLWFPTGGGKTEAYLGLIAFESFRRRLENPVSGGGTVAIKRYTLRLLTTQQFTRASTLLCAMELMRRADPDTFGSEAFRIGLWIGGSQSPNTFADARTVAEKVRNENVPISKFFVTQCPYCGTASVPAKKSNQPDDYGFCAQGDSFSLFCTKDCCPFSNVNGCLPIDIVDESIYQHPPTLVIATIDKFAQLPWNERSASMFGGTTHLPPSLIIQDELHLISGPLGTIAGVYEAAIDLLCSRNGIRPKIIAATATIRRAEEQCRALYGRDVNVFPPPGLSSEDSFFSREDVEDAGRMYVGLMPQGVKRQTAMVRTCAALWQAPKALRLQGAELDAYWTLVAYHNSRRELGKTMTAMRDDVVSRIEALVSDRNLRRTNRSPLLMELSSQAASSEPGGTAAIIDRIKISVNEEGVVDAVPCTNMISVGVDIPRLSLMLLYGQPKTAAEYIQASSRIGRVATRPPGLAVVLLSPNKPRDRSHYEMFCGFHDSLYRFVEPSSVTPYSPPALLRALPGMLVACIRLIAGLQDNADAHRFNIDNESCRDTITKLRVRMSAAAGADADRALEELDRVVNTWMRLIRANLSLQYRKNRRPSPALLVKYDARQGLIGRNGELVALDSMRNVDGETAVLVRP